MWGRGDVNQLGISFSKLTIDDIGYVALKPMKLKEISKKKVLIISVTCGEAHTIALDSEGKMHAFGWGEDGQLGLDENFLQDSIMSNNIKCIESIAHKIIKISAGCIFSACLTDMGQVFVWGNGEQGQLGLGMSIKSINFPTLVSSLRHEFILDIVCGNSFMLSISQSGNVYGWGRGITGKFYDEELYSSGSDIICFVPRIISKFDIVQKYLIHKQNQVDSFSKILMEKLMKLHQLE